MNILYDIIKSRKKTFLVILAMVLINILLYIFIFNFQAPKLESLQSRLLETRQRQTIGPEDKTLVYSRGKEDLEVFHAKIPPKKEFMRVVGELFEIASDNGLTIGNVGYKPQILKDQGILVYGLTFSVSGSYAAIKSFTSDLERSREMLAIDHISLQSADSTPDSVDFSIQISTFFKAETP